MITETTVVVGGLLGVVTIASGLIGTACGVIWERSNWNSFIRDCSSDELDRMVKTLRKPTLSLDPEVEKVYQDATGMGEISE